MRSRIRGSSRLVSAKCPRWLVPICNSKPSFVRVSGVAMTPALLIRMSRSPCQESASSRTDARSARSRRRTSTVPGMPAAARSPLAVSRTASVTRAPARASSRAAMRPIPLLAPVTTTVRPSRLGRSAAVHLEEVMDGNVDADNNDVNVYICRYPSCVADVATRPYHHGNLRAALLERAERVVSERGVHALSLRELAREVGVSHAAPRRHFADRQALLDALALEGFRFATRHAALVELMFAAKHRPGAEELEDAAQRAFAMVLALIDQAQAAGELVAGDCERIG